MTAVESNTVAKAKAGGPLGFLVRSMWGFWFFLLTFSLGVAAVIYYVWLRGTL